ELAAMIRDHPRFQRTAIIFISAIHLSEADYLRGYEAGAVDYVPVPVVPELLRAKVRVFAELHRKTKQLEELNRDLEVRVAERTAELQAAAGRLMKSEQGREVALAAGNMGSWDFDYSDGSWRLDEGQFRIFGIDPKASQFTPQSAQSLIHPDDWQVLMNAVQHATSVRNTFQAEIRVIRTDGEIRWCLVAAAGTFGSDEKLQRINGVTIDITDRKEIESYQMLLAREVDHRARNALALVQAIIRLGRADDVETYVDVVNGRIRALAKTHELLSESRWQGADVARLIEEEVAPYRTGDGRIAMHGPALNVPPDKAQTVSLIVHELATNAAKYGALSDPAGSVAIGWSLDGEFLVLQWTETGGPPVSPPQKQGFGTKIIGASLNKQRDEDANFDWRPEGLRCTIKLVCAPFNLSGASKFRPVGSLARKLNGAAARKQILVVEDEAIIGMLTCDHLTGLGYQVEGPFADLTEAIAVAGSRRFDGAVLDVNLGGNFVFPLARILQEQSVPFVFVTGYREDIVEGGFDKVPILRKPIPSEELESALRTAMDGARAGRSAAVGG
ncbi:MAG: HWE histidine kinase domain-containing protein, partial [Rhizomicrobium sp.]